MRSLLIALTLHNALVIANDIFRVQTDKVTHSINADIMGCHSDLGYVHQNTGWSAQMVWGMSFEEAHGGWSLGSRDGASARLDPTYAYNGITSLRLNPSPSSATGASGAAGAVNYGFNSHGLQLVGQKDYRISMYVSTNNTGTQTMMIALGVGGGRVVFSESVRVSTGVNQWVRFETSLKPAISSVCSKAPGTCRLGPQAGHVCLNCTGSLTVGIEGPSTSEATLWVDSVELYPGTWALVHAGPSRKAQQRKLLGPTREPKVHLDGQPPSEYLPVWRSVASMVDNMGVTLIRFGGSYATDSSFFWKNFRGAVARRPAVSWGYTSDYSSWGPFEMMDLCAAMGWKAVITLYGFAYSSPQSVAQPADFADLVEYLYGDADTEWGAVRHADGHPDVYSVTTFEIGNEQQPPQWVETVRAMEAAAKKVGMGGKFQYIWPNNGGWTVDGVLGSVKDLKQQIVWDIHSNGWNGVQLGVQEEHRRDAVNDQWVMLNLETNAGINGMTRASMEMLDLNNQLAYPDARLQGRAASFCFGKSGDFDYWNQMMGMFVLSGEEGPTGWIQPPGWVHSLLQVTWADDGLAIAGYDPTNPPSFPEVSASAAKGEKGRVSVRVNIPPPPSSQLRSTVTELMATVSVDKNVTQVPKTVLALQQYVDNNAWWVRRAEDAVRSGRVPSLTHDRWTVRWNGSQFDWHYTVNIALDGGSYDIYEQYALSGPPGSANSYDRQTQYVPNKSFGRFAQTNGTFTIPAPSVYIWDFHPTA